MITLETKDKRWQEMREDLAKRLTAIGFGGDYDPDGTKNYNFTKRYSFRILNGTPKLSQVQSIIRNWQLDWEKQLNGSK